MIETDNIKEIKFRQFTAHIACKTMQKNQTLIAVIKALFVAEETLTLYVQHCCFASNLKASA
jgi:hypothetical protein